MYLSNALELTQFWEKVARAGQALVYFRPPMLRTGQVLQPTDFERMRLYLEASSSAHIQLVADGRMVIFVYAMIDSFCQLASMLALNRIPITSVVPPGHSDDRFGDYLDKILEPCSPPRVVLLCGNLPVCSMVDPDPTFEDDWVTVLCPYEDGQYHKSELFLPVFGGKGADERTQDAPVT